MASRIVWRFRSCRNYAFATRAMNVLYPKIPFAALPAMLAYAAGAAVLAGLYGIAHDQLTYSISPEYFTRLKFPQFHHADFGLPARVFVAEIGFLARSEEHTSEIQ